MAELSVERRAELRKWFAEGAYGSEYVESGDEVSVSEMAWLLSRAAEADLLAERDAEIARLRAENERLTQRSNLLFSLGREYGWTKDHGRNEASFMAGVVEGLRAKLAAAERERDEARQNSHDLYMAEGPWMWMDEVGENHVASLTCPVMLSALQIKTLVKERDAMKLKIEAVARAERYRAVLERTRDELPLRQAANLDAVLKHVDSALAEGES